MLSAFAVKRAVKVIQSDRKRIEAGCHFCQGFWLLSSPGIERLTRGMRIVSLAGASQIIEQRAWARAGRSHFNNGGQLAGSPP